MVCQLSLSVCQDNMSGSNDSNATVSDKDFDMDPSTSPERSEPEQSPVKQIPKPKQTQMRKHVRRPRSKMVEVERFSVSIQGTSKKREGIDLDGMIDEPPLASLPPEGRVKKYVSLRGRGRGRTTSSSPSYFANEPKKKISKAQKLIQSEDARVQAARERQRKALEEEKLQEQQAEEERARAKHSAQERFVQEEPKQEQSVEQDKAIVVHEPSSTSGLQGNDEQENVEHAQDENIENEPSAQQEENLLEQVGKDASEPRA